MILLIDNYDSFVHNLARYFERLGQETHVVRNDAIDVAGVRARRPDAVVLSPGPCGPEQAGSSMELVRSLAGELPMLGVCLGHQAIAAALGGRVVRAGQPVHGRATEVTHDGSGIFADLPNPFLACRYHSLVVEEASLPPDLAVTARSADGEVMGIAHRRWPVVGVQFHPESILTEPGYELLAGFLGLCGLKSPRCAPTIAAERAAPTPPPSQFPATPVTF